MFFNVSVFIDYGRGMIKFYNTLLLLFIGSFAPFGDIKSEISRKDAFTYIYNHKEVWDGTESASGVGSTLVATETLRCLLPAILKALDVQVLLDAGCGDLNWIKRIPLHIEHYIGVDIVEDLIQKNTNTYPYDWVQFLCLDITHDNLPASDLILCRDCLQHLSFEDIKSAINNFKKSGATYLLATTYVNLLENKHDIKSGWFHVVNLMKAPYNFPEPIFAFDELSAEDEMRVWRKRMCVWKLEDISDLQ